MDEPRWVPGDFFGLPIPADAAALRTDPVSFLDDAFHRFGSLSPDNHVTAVTQFEECAGGSTGRKLLLSLSYARPEPGLPTELFVKFSRDFDNPRRDRGRTQMAREVRFAVLARGDFPINIPTATFADYHGASGTGVLITERIPFGTPPVEPHYDKCLDYRMPDPLGHYEALLTAVARVAGAQRAGRLDAGFADGFEFDPDLVNVGQPIVYSPSQLHDRVAAYAQFAAALPGLVPQRLREAEFVERMHREVEGIAAAADSVRKELNSVDDHVALCHWNANVDNAWFWRSAAGLQCGLLDWGCVSEMNVAMALWGALCSAETSLWECHLEHLLAHFADEFEAAGGPRLDAGEIRRQLVSYALVMGVTWLLDAPGYLRALVPDLDTVADRYDPRISDNEAARAQLLMLTNFLHLWQSGDSADVPGAAV
ncbi:hypothetical protein [Mycolicibacterium sp.]|uniref:hypothetical protein n=1 Tax=Mycolicibacterium sp. TaxID=2320850 RepID=UPI003560478C